MNPADPDLLQEEQILSGAHAHSVLYNTAVLLLDRSGRCVRSVPNGSAFRGESFGDRAWFQAVRGGDAGPLFRITDEPSLGQTLKIVQPVVRGGTVRRRAGGRHRPRREQPDLAHLPGEPAARHRRRADRPGRRVRDPGAGDLPAGAAARGRRVGLGAGDRRRLAAAPAGRWSARPTGRRRCSPTRRSAAGRGTRWSSPGPGGR